MPTYDIYTVRTGPSGDKPMSFGFVSAVAAAGAIKVITRWIKCFLTPKGSDHTDFDYGTGFMGILGGNVADVQDVLDQMNGFIADCNTQMHAMDQVNLPPPEEQFGSAAISKVVQIDAGSYHVWVNVTNATGGVGAMLLPTVSA